MQTVTTIDLDIAKSVFQVHGVDAGGQMVTDLTKVSARVQLNSVEAHGFAFEAGPLRETVRSGRSCADCGHPVRDCGLSEKGRHIWMWR